MIDTAAAPRNRHVMHTAQNLIDSLQLSPHPEGGWYRETWRAVSHGNVRPASTLIHFLLCAGERSHWHRVDADEIWLWHGGNPLALQIAATDNAEPQTLLLGPDIGSGQMLQAVVPAGQWQSAEPVAGDHGYVLVSCVVAPGFDFSGFELAPERWAPGQ